MGNETPNLNDRNDGGDIAAALAIPFQGELPSRETIATHLLELVGTAFELDAEAASRCVGDTLILFQNLLQRSGDARGKLAHWQVVRVKGYVADNLGRKIDTADLARVTRLSSSYFSYAFKQTIGVSPYAYILEQRVGRARAMLIDTESPLSTIALDCGFSDQAHFSRTFRRSVGETPNAWRRRRRES